MFPGLEVKCFGSGGTGEEIHCELDWKGVGRSVLVVAGLGSVTVGLDGDGGGGEAGAWVVRSERLKSHERVDGVRGYMIENTHMVRALCLACKK